MTWLSDELPNAVLQSLQSIRENSTATSTNTTSIVSGSAPTSSLREVWLDVAAYYPLVSLWPLALLLSLVAINILAILLLATWRLARSSLAWSTAYKFGYSSNGTRRTKRKLRLPGNGAVLGLLLCGSIAQVVQIVRWSNWGRLSWLDPVCAYARTAAFVCTWIVVLFVTVSSIQTVPLLDATSSLLVPVSRSLSRPALHPLLVTGLVIILPTLVCAIPAIALLFRSLGHITAFEAVLSQDLQSANTTPPPPNVSSDLLKEGFDGIVSDWKLQGYGRAIAVFVLLGVVVLVETSVRSRLRKIAVTLRDSEEALLASGKGDEYNEGSHVPGLYRSHSGRSAGGYSQGSYKSSRSAFEGKRHLMLPQKVELDLPSPSLMKDGDLEFVYPELAYHPQAPDYGERQVSLPGGPRRMSSYCGSERSYSSSGHQAGSEYGYPAHLTAPVRSMSRQTLLLPQLVRSRSYASASSRHSCSCGSASSAYSYGEKPAMVWHGPYSGPSSMDVAKQRNARLVEVMILGAVLVLSCIFEGVGAAIKSTVLEHRRLDAAFQITIIVLQILPTLGGLLLSAVRDDGPSYGWLQNRA